MKRQEELIEAWCKHRGKCSTEDMQALDFALRWCDKHPNWISVDDELPKNNGGFSDEVLTFNPKTRVIEVAQFSYVSNCWFGCGDDIAYWMPLPPTDHLADASKKADHSIDTNKKVEHLIDTNKMMEGE